MKWLHSVNEVSTRRGGFSDFLTLCKIKSSDFFDNVVEFCCNGVVPDVSEINSFMSYTIAYLETLIPGTEFYVKRSRVDSDDPERIKALQSSPCVVNTLDIACSNFTLSKSDIDVLREQALAYLQMTAGRRNKCESQD
jgi:hypothetical protein